MRATALLVGVIVCGGMVSPVMTQPLRPGPPPTPGDASATAVPDAAREALARQAGAATLGTIEAEMLDGASVLGPVDRRRHVPRGDGDGGGRPGRAG